MQAKELSQAQGSFDVLTWYLGEQLYGLSLEDCKEVIKNVEILSIPHSKKYIAGVHNLRGEIITVIDPAVKMGYPRSSSGKGKAVIRLKKKSKVSILADRIHDILTIPLEKIGMPPSNLNEKEIKCIASVAMSEIGIILLLNLEGLTAIE